MSPQPLQLTAYLSHDDLGPLPLLMNCHFHKQLKISLTDLRNFPQNSFIKLKPRKGSQNLNTQGRNSVVETILQMATSNTSLWNNKTQEMRFYLCLWNTVNKQTFLRKCVHQGVQGQ